MARPDICVIVSPTQQEVYFTVTQKYTISRSANVTDFRIEDGRKITDHHTPDNRRFVFSGVVTTQAALGETEGLDPSTVLLKLDTLIETGETFKFISDSDLSFTETDDCVLINYDINRDETMADAVEVSVEIRQVQFTSSVTRTTATEVSIAMKDRADTKKNKGVTSSIKPTLEDDKRLAEVEAIARKKKAGDF